jgi:phospholipase/carboxylesterase
MLETEFIPAEQAGSTRLMIVLHGLGDSTAGFRWLPATLNLPWLNYLLVNAPDTYYGGFSWYDFTGDMTAGVKRSTKLLFQLLELQRAKGFSTDQTTMLGFSQGSLMTIEIGLRYPHRFAGLVGISGYVSDPEKLIEELSPVAREQRFLITHGYQDPIVPFAETREQINILKAGGLHIDWHEFQKGHTIAGEQELGIIRDFVVVGYPLPSPAKK